MIIFHNVFLSKPEQPKIKRYHDKYLHTVANLEPRFLCGKRERDRVFGKSASLTSFPELLHVNFSVIGGKIFGPCLFCAVVQLANLSMDNVIDALAANVIITSTQTINRAWKFEGLVNMVQESSAIDWLKAFTRVGVFNTVAQSLVNWKGKVQGQETHTESWPANMNHFRAWLENEAWKSKPTVIKLLFATSLINT